MAITIEHEVSDRSLRALSAAQAQAVVATYLAGEQVYTA
jgi:hypothetical protein